MTDPRPLPAGADAIPARLPIPDADPKPWWQSRTIVASLAVVASQLATLLGVSLDAGMLTEVALSVAAAVAGVVAIYGRARAEQPIAPLLRR